MLRGALLVPCSLVKIKPMVVGYIGSAFSFCLFSFFFLFLISGLCVLVGLCCFGFAIGNSAVYGTRISLKDLIPICCFFLCGFC